MPDSLSDITYVGGGVQVGDDAYYYVDDVSLVPLDSLLAVPTIGTVEVDVYPNPATDFIRVESREKLHGVALLDVRGRLRQEGGLWRTDIVALPVGIYLVEATAEDGRRAVRKVVKGP
jgi:hypothetical protein